MEDLHSKEELVFMFNTWLASDKGEEFRTLKEVPALRAGVDPFPGKLMIFNKLFFLKIIGKLGKFDFVIYCKCSENWH